VSIDVARARADTPGTASVAHLNNAGSALPPAPVLDAVIEHLRLEAEIGGYEAAADRAGRVEHTYEAIARLIGAQRDEIAVVENATRAWDMAFYSLKLHAGDRILTTNAEYASNYIPMRQVADRTGAAVVVVPDDEHGQVDVAALASMLDERVKLVSLVHVPTQGGLVNPAAAGCTSPPWLGTCTSETSLTRSSSIAVRRSTSTWPCSSSGTTTTAAPVRSATCRIGM